VDRTATAPLVVSQDARPIAARTCASVLMVASVAPTFLLLRSVDADQTASVETTVIPLVDVSQSSILHFLPTPNYSISYFNNY